MKAIVFVSFFVLVVSLVVANEETMSTVQQNTLDAGLDERRARKRGTDKGAGAAYPYYGYGSYGGYPNDGYPYSGYPFGGYPYGGNPYDGYPNDVYPYYGYPIYY